MDAASLPDDELELHAPGGDIDDFDDREAAETRKLEEELMMDSPEKPVSGDYEVVDQLRSQSKHAEKNSVRKDDTDLEEFSDDSQTTMTKASLSGTMEIDTSSEAGNNSHTISGPSGMHIDEPSTSVISIDSPAQPSTAMSRDSRAEKIKRNEKCVQNVFRMQTKSKRSRSRHKLPREPSVTFCSTSMSSSASFARQSSSGLSYSDEESVHTSHELESTALFARKCQMKDLLRKLHATCEAVFHTNPLSSIDRRDTGAHLILGDDGISPIFQPQIKKLDENLNKQVNVILGIIKDEQMRVQQEYRQQFRRESKIMFASLGPIDKILSISQDTATLENQIDDAEDAHDLDAIEARYDPPQKMEDVQREKKNIGERVEFLSNLQVNLDQTLMQQFKPLQVVGGKRKRPISDSREEYTNHVPNGPYNAPNDPHYAPNGMRIKEEHDPDAIIISSDDSRPNSRPSSRNSIPFVENHQQNYLNVNHLNPPPVITYQHFNRNNGLFSQNTVENNMPSRHRSKRQRKSLEEPDSYSTEDTIEEKSYEFIENLDPPPRCQLIHVPSRKIDTGRKKDYKKSRYMSLTASLEFRKEVLICDILHNEIVLYNAITKTQVELNRHTLQLAAGELQQPSASCFIRDGQSSCASRVAFLCLDGIYVAERHDNLFTVFCKYSIKNKPKNTLMKIGHYIGLFHIKLDDGDYLCSLNRTEQKFHFFKIPEEPSDTDLSRKSRLDKRVKFDKQDIMHCRYLSFQSKTNMVTLCMMDSKILARFKYDGSLDDTFHNDGIFDLTKYKGEPIEQPSGFCELQNGALLLCDNGRKINGKNRIFLIRPSEQYHEQGSMEEVQILCEDKKTPIKNLRPSDIGAGSKFIYITAHPYGYKDGNSEAKIWTFRKNP